jgi:hypothetical protein
LIGINPTQIQFVSWMVAQLCVGYLERKLVMPRQSLADQHSDAGGSPFFPSFQKEMNRLIVQFRTGLPMPEAAWESVFGAPERACAHS